MKNEKTYVEIQSSASNNAIIYSHIDNPGECVRIVNELKNHKEGSSMRIFFFFISIIVLFASCTTAVAAKRLHHEEVYQTQWCNERNGVMEYELADKTRVDCLTDTMAVEFDFSNKWAECIGQALYYGLQTNKTPVCVLIMENGDSDIKYLKRLQTVSDKHGIRIETITPTN